MRVMFLKGQRNWTPAEKKFLLHILNDPRSWGIPVTETDDFEDAEWYVFLHTGSYIHSRYHHLNPEITGKLSVTDRRNPRDGIVTIFNLENWSTVPGAFNGDLNQYRTYLINHEFGHALGRGHATCRSGPAPVMVQQTKGTGKCTICVWPRLCGDI